MIVDLYVLNTAIVWLGFENKPIKYEILDPSTRLTEFLGTSVTLL